MGLSTDIPYVFREEGSATRLAMENFIQKNNDYGRICAIVINTGKFWGKNSFIKYPGVAKIKFLPLIDKDENYKTINVVLTILSYFGHVASIFLAYFMLSKIIVNLPNLLRLEQKEILSTTKKRK